MWPHLTAGRAGKFKGPHGYSVSNIYISHAEDGGGSASQAEGET